MARTGPVGPVWQCPLMGVDRMSPAKGETGAFDPNRTSRGLRSRPSRTQMAGGTMLRPDPGGRR
jgi:hypothetical protein